MAASQKTFKGLAEKVDVPWIKEAYAIIAGRAPKGGDYVADAADPQPAVAHPPDEINKLKSIQYEAVMAARVADGQHLQTLQECLDGIKAGFVRDGFWNPMSGFGSTDDPGMYSYAYTPVSMSPQEATSYYSSGGLPKVIIDKKSKGIMLNGYTFDGEGWSTDDLKRLHDYAELLGFAEAQTSGVRDALCYGGAVLYPRLKKDNSATMEMTVEELLQAGVLEQNSIEHFVTADRWNTVMVPNWNVTARDYLHPSHYYIPIGGVKVATERSAIIRPNPLPYWGMLPQMGWGISDFEGWIPSVLAYTLLVMAIPIMAQQMSLLFHEIPIDATIAMMGVDPSGMANSPVDTLIAHNNRVMRTWSIMHPATINSFGKVSAVERHYEGFGDLVKTLQDDIGARSEIPTSTLFMSQPQGLASDRGDDVELKEAAAVQKVGATVKSQMKPVARMIAIGCFGIEHFEGQNARLLDTIGVVYDSPTIQTPKQKAEAGGKFAEMVQKFVASDIPVDVALDLSRQFFPGIQIDPTITARLRQLPTGVPEGFAGGQEVAELEGVIEKGRLIEQLLKPGAYMGSLGGGNGIPKGAGRETGGSRIDPLVGAATDDDVPADGTDRLVEAMEGTGEKIESGLAAMAKELAGMLGKKLVAVQDEVRSLAEKPAPQTPPQPPIHVTVPVEVILPGRKSTKTTYTGDRDENGTLKLDTIVKTEVEVDRE